MSGHEEMNEQLRQAFGVRVGGRQPDEGSAAVNRWIRSERDAGLLFPVNAEPDETGDRGEAGR